MRPGSPRSGPSQQRCRYILGNLRTLPTRPRRRVWVVVSAAVWAPSAGPCALFGRSGPGEPSVVVCPVFRRSVRQLHRVLLAFPPGTARVRRRRIYYIICGLCPLGRTVEVGRGICRKLGSFCGGPRVFCPGCTAGCGPGAAAGKLCTLAHLCPQLHRYPPGPAPRVVSPLYQEIYGLSPLVRNVDLGSAPLPQFGLGCRRGTRDLTLCCGSCTVTRPGAAVAAILGNIRAFPTRPHSRP